MSEQIQSFTQLRVYQKACALDEAVFAESKKWPREEKFALTDQTRRAVRSIGANIAEAWAKRRYPAHFVSKLTDADGELNETRHWISRAATYGYSTSETRDELLALADEIGRMFGKMLSSPEGFSTS